ncbi:hypothetical protein DKY63_01870 [Pseudomonas putida]|uniref:Uncharacterized protein n=1 Tax=Pseudomonas putida TaxID=303 RepID=A0A2Z4REG4_PSEPU|nr:hypothetical protein DKY63_01870 [Pseudomonas putida]
MDANDYAGSLTPRGALGFLASMLAHTERGGGATWYNRSSSKSLLLFINLGQSRPCFGRALPVGYSDAFWPGGK